MTMESNTYQVKMWSWQTDYQGCLPETTIHLLSFTKTFKHYFFNSDHLNLIRGAIERDTVHATVYRLTLNGWPDRMQNVPHIAHHFWGTRDKLTIEEGVLLKGNNVCIPPELHDRTLYDLQNSHHGVGKMTHLARNYVYWPRINVNIADYVKCCTICA